MALQDESFGVVPLSLENGEWKVFLIQHRHGRYWGFPKGHAEKGEVPEEAAIRELKEETNLEIVRFLQKETLMEQYQFTLEKQRVFKRVYYFVAVVQGDVILQKNEISDGKWLSIPNALIQVTHPEGKSILVQVEKILKSI